MFDRAATMVVMALPFDLPLPNPPATIPDFLAKPLGQLLSWTTGICSFIGIIGLIFIGIQLLFGSERSSSIKENLAKWLVGLFLLISAYPLVSLFLTFLK